MGGFFRLLQAYPETLHKYEYFWFPDNDNKATSEDLNKLFRIAAAQRLHVFQASLDNRSYYPHLITLRHHGFSLRYTNFVETIVPGMSRKVLKRILPLFEGTRFGFGFDFLLPEIAAQMTGDQKSSAIFDVVSVCHTRPVGGALHQTAGLAGQRSSLEELQCCMGLVLADKKASIAGVAVPRVRLLVGLKENGSKISPFGTSVKAAVSFLLKYRNKVEPTSAVQVLKHSLKTMIHQPTP